MHSKPQKTCSFPQICWYISTPTYLCCSCVTCHLTELVPSWHTIMPDGSERPIGYASRSLMSSQRNYSQLEREALALVFGVQHFHSYLFGHHFELVTDHQPLLALLHEHRPTSSQASTCVRRWSLLLSAYEYSITFWKTQSHLNADALTKQTPIT